MLLYDGPLRPGVFRGPVDEVDGDVEASTAAAVDVCGRDIRDDARASFIGQHAYGTPSPARLGGPPSRIASSLDESLTWTTPLAEPKDG